MLNVVGVFQTFRILCVFVVKSSNLSKCIFFMIYMDNDSRFIDHEIIYILPTSDA